MATKKTYWPAGLLASDRNVLFSQLLHARAQLCGNEFKAN